VKIQSFCEGSVEIGLHMGIFHESDWLLLMALRKIYFSFECSLYSLLLFEGFSLLIISWSKYY